MNIDMNEKLLEVLCCPETHQSLSKADQAVLKDLNKKIDQGILVNKAQQKVQEKMEEGLLREDGKILYPVRHGIPVMLVDEGIPLPQ